jgi:riboflavin kinase/FMN adenylyltransferase
MVSVDFDSSVFGNYGLVLCGRVIAGNKIGRTIGFPTANIKPDNISEESIPTGVFLVEVELENSLHWGICNIGNRPTIGGSSKVTEVNILDFNEDIYGCQLCIRLISRIRDEMKFESLQALTLQIRMDKETALTLISTKRKPDTC